MGGVWIGSRDMHKGLLGRGQGGLILVQSGSQAKDSPGSTVWLHVIQY